MKTAMILPVWLGTEAYIKKTEKFLDYYTQPQVLKDLGITVADIWLIDNASPQAEVDKIKAKYNVSIKQYHKHYARTAHLEYLFCWRCLYFARDLFQEYDYDKVIHLNNDVFILSKRLASFIEKFKSGWWSPWCPKHKFKECDLQVITKDCQDYWDFTGDPYIRHNGSHMEHLIRAPIDKSWIGDRYAEYTVINIPDNADFSTQTKLETLVEYKP